MGRAGHGGMGGKGGEDQMGKGERGGLDGSAHTLADKELTKTQC